MCTEVIKNKNLEQRQRRFVQSAIFKAVERGHIEFITHILKVNPQCAEMTDARGMNIFDFAAECRQEKIFSLIYGLNQRERSSLVNGADNLNNSLLHLVGNLPPYGQLDHIQDAALRMQRELQWFEVGFQYIYLEHVVHRCIYGRSSQKKQPKKIKEKVIIT